MLGQGQPFINDLHSLVRWIVVIVGVVTIVKLALGLIQKGAFTGLDRGLTMAFSITMDIQILIGLLNLVTRGFDRVNLEHTFVMILALVAVHLPMRWRNAPDAVRFRNTLISFVVSLVLVYIGVALVNGWVG